jgi:hypothetical protein
MIKTLDQSQIDVERSLHCSRHHQPISAGERESLGSGCLEDRVLRIASGAPLTPREIRFAGIFALLWFAMDGFWFISTLNHWFGL